MEKQISPQHRHFPPMVVVSVGTKCNYMCDHCFYPTYIQQTNYCQYNMDLEVFKKIAKEIAEHPKSVLRLIAWGEPLLHPQLVDFVRYMKKIAPKNKVTLITNGSLLTSKYSENLLQAGLDMIEISLDAATESTYAIRRRNNIKNIFSRVQANVRDFIKQKDKLGSNCKILVSYIVWPDKESEKEFEKFFGIWSDIVDDVVKRPLHSFKGTIPIQHQIQDNRVACFGLWARCDITPWGEISVCYNDWERSNILTDLKKIDVNIENTWNGDKLHQLQEGQQKGKFCGICKDCKDYNPNSWHNPYERIIERCFGDNK